MTDTIHDELQRQFLAAFTAMEKGKEDAPYINANLYGKDRVRIRMREPEMEMTKEQFLGFCRGCIRAIKKIERKT